jgi:hypothetical protein
MAVPTDITTGVQSFSTTGALTPTTGLDVSGATYSGDLTLCLEAIMFTAGKTAQIQIEGSVNAFTASTAIYVTDIQGQVGEGGTSAFVQGVFNPTTLRRSVRKYQIPSAGNVYFGQSGGKIRVNVTNMDSSAEGAVHAWIET